MITMRIMPRRHFQRSLPARSMVARAQCRRETRGGNVDKHGVYVTTAEVVSNVK